MYDNIEWLKTMFGQSHMQHIPLVESFNCKWCYFKHGQFYYNPKQAAIAKPLEFKLFALDICYNSWEQIKVGPCNIKKQSKG